MLTRISFLHRVSLVFLPAAAFSAALFPPLPAFAQKQNTPAKSAVSVAPIVYQKRTLANGLTVFSVQNKQSPAVAIQVWYKVGSKNDPPNRSGFAHLFEHIMFKATRNMKDETLDRLTEDVGGENNAFTQSDVTVYHETVPSNYLPTLLWAEAERMASLSVNQAAFVSERAVVEEEYRQSVLAPPYGRLYNSVDVHSFNVHPYKRPTIGSIADLDKSTLANVVDFHNTFYRPDNAVLVVVGDFDQKTLNGYIDKYFGKIKRPQKPIPRVTAKEPARVGGPKVFNETAPNVPLPAIVMTYLTPNETNADAEPLRVLDTILSGGEASRLYQELVYKQQIASDASSGADLRPDAGLFQLSATAASGKSLEAVQKSLLAEVTKIQKTPPTQAELIKARNQILASTLGSRQTNAGIAFALADAAVLQGNPQRANTDLARLQAVTAQDVQRVAQKYLTPQNRVVINYTSGKSAAQSVSANPTSAKIAPLPPFKPLETPPPPTAPRPLQIPTPTEKTLANGLRVIAVPGDKSGLVTMELVSKTGGASDPNDEAGRADFSASLLTKGTTTRTAPQIASQIEALGGSISSGASYDSATVSMNVLKNNLEAALPIFADVILHPAFAPEEIDRLRTQNLDDLTVGLQSPGTLARYAASRVVFGDGPYGHPLGGTPQTLPKLTQYEVSLFHRTAFIPDNCVLVVGGDIDEAAAFALAETHFGAWSGPFGNAGHSNDLRFDQLGPNGPDATRKRVLVIDKPGAGQAAVLLVRPTIARNDHDFYAGTVANAVLGGGYSARLNREVRVKRGLSYGAGSGLTARKYGGIFSASAQTKNPTAPDVAQIFTDELQNLADKPTESSELAPRKASLAGNYARNLETGAGLVGAVAGLTVYDLPLSELSRYLTSVEEVNADDVQKFAQTKLSANEAHVIIVGDAQKFLPALRKQFGDDIEIIPAAQLDLNRADLRKPKP